MWRTSRSFAPSAFVAFLLSAQGASAQERDPAGAQALFDEGKKLMTEGKLAEACPKLVESLRLDPGGGTSMAVALCHEAEGKTATAWADFNVALSDARRDRRNDREGAALEHIRNLEPKLTRVRVLVTKELEGLQILRNGVPVGKAQWSTPVPVDPG
jgi:hypothetical protein